MPFAVNRYGVWFSWVFHEEFMRWVIAKIRLSFKRSPHGARDVRVHREGTEIILSRRLILSGYSSASRQSVAFFCGLFRICRRMPSSAFSIVGNFSFRKGEGVLPVGLVGRHGSAIFHAHPFRQHRFMISFADAVAARVFFRCPQEIY